MKGIVLAGGSGSRLSPLTKVTNKHLLPVGNKPMIYYPIEKMVNSGVTNILIVTGTEHMGAIVSLLGSGKNFGCKFTYKVQDESGGIAQALGLAEDFIGNDNMMVILGDNIFEDDLSDIVKSFVCGAKIILKNVEDPERYGVAEFASGIERNVVSIEEKPKKPKSNYAVTGIYLYDNRVFDVIRGLRPSGRGELEITDVNNWYVKQGQMQSNELVGWWTDAGTFESLSLANILVGKK